MSGKTTDADGDLKLKALDESIEAFWKTISLDEKIRNPKLGKKVRTLKRILLGVREARKMKNN